MFFEIRRVRKHPSETQLNVWEPREGRGRLRHCNGLQTPTRHWPRKRLGRRERGEARSQDTGSAVLVRFEYP